MEVPLSWYRKSIETTARLSIDFKPTGSPIDETMYPSTKARQLSNKDIQDLKDLFSGKKNVELSRSTQKIQLLIRSQWQLNMIKHGVSVKIMLRKKNKLVQYSKVDKVSTY